MKVAGLSVIIFLYLFSEINAFDWTSDLQDGADVYACVGDNIRFPWNYSLDHGETVQEIKWYYHYGNDSRESIAAVVEGRFFLLSTNFSDKIGHTGTAGLSVTSLTGLDSGRYSVTVTVHRGSCFTTYNHTAVLVVAEDPLVQQNEALWARQEDAAVYDNTTGQMHVQVSCGKYVITGRAPVYVEWTLPSGEKRLVSRHINGTFFLPLANPLKGGNYTCRLSSKLPPVSCLPQNSSVFRSSSVSVDEVKMRLSLLEAEQETLKTQKHALHKVMNYFRELKSSKVKFDVRPATGLVVINDGNAYRAQEKAFVAPFSGTYVFTVSTSDRDSSSFIVSLCDDTTCFCHAHSRRHDHEARSCQAIVYRSQGQKVWIRRDPEESSRYNVYNYDSLNFGDHSTSFSGFSLHPDVKINV